MNAVEASGLGVGYRGASVIEGIDVSLAAGASLALVGTNGSGKSTFIRTLVGLLPPTAGAVRVLGAEPGASPARVAYLSQFHETAHILPIRAVDVVRMGRFAHLGLLRRPSAEDERLVRVALERMGIEDLAAEPLRDMSGGQRQRVYLAQVLARRGDLIILDEPTSGLDAGGRERYMAAFADEVERGAALITATHDIAEAIEFDEVMLMAGHVVALGPGREVLTPDRLMETFGILVRDPHEEHVGRFTIAERSRGAPQTIDTRPDA